jgi:hypothetical protein
MREIWALDVPYRAKIVMLALVDYGARAFPSQATLARKCGMSVATLQRVLEGLRRDNLVATESRGKALRYYVKLRDQIPQIEVGDTSNCGRDQNYPTEPTYPTGRAGEDDGTVDRITSRTPSANVPKQREVCSRVLGTHGIAGGDSNEAFGILLRHWARTGNDAYSTLKRLSEDMGGARSAAKVLLHKIRGLE